MRDLTAARLKNCSILVRRLWGRLLYRRRFLTEKRAVCLLIRICRQGLACNQSHLCRQICPFKVIFHKRGRRLCLLLALTGRCRQGSSAHQPRRHLPRKGLGILLGGRACRP